MEKKKTLTWKFWQIKTKEDAWLIMREVSILLFFVGGLQIILGFFTGLVMILDGVMFIVLGLLLYYLKSRIVSVLILMISFLGLGVTFYNRISAGAGGRNIFLALLVFYSAIAGVYAAFKYNKK